MVIATGKKYNEMPLNATTLAHTFNLASLNICHLPSATTLPLINGLIPQIYLTFLPKVVSSTETTTRCYGEQTHSSHPFCQASF